MTQYLKIAATILMASLLASCEKVLDVQLDAAEIKPVIEAIITDQPGSCQVAVSYTHPFSETNIFEGTGGAAVSITDDAGTTTLLTETTTGIYRALSLTGVPGHTYSLSVTLSGNKYTAVSTMPYPVGIDSLFTALDNTFGDDHKTVNVVFRDPGSTGNEYRFVQYRNGIRQENITIRNDERFNGNRITLPIRNSGSDDEDKLQTGDSVSVDLQCISHDMYLYLYGLSRNTPDIGQSATPANPETNIKGGALGYFSTHTSQTRKIVVQ